MTRRILPTLLIGLCCLPMAVVAQSPESTETPQRESGNPDVQTLAVSRPVQNAASNLLLKRIESVDWVDKPFEEILDWLKREGEDQVNVVPRWNALNVENVGRDTIINLQLNNSKIADVLNEMIDQLSPDGQLKYQAMGNTLRISTRDDFDRKMHLRVYNATDILFKVPNFGQEAPSIDLQQAGRGGGGGGGGGSGQSVFQGGGSSGGSSQEDSGEQAEQDIRDRLEELRTIIEQTIAPETWDTGTAGTQVGGKGRIRVYNRSLIVYNTIEVHEMIAGRFIFE